MTTSSWAAVVAHGTDADFRAWGSDYSAHLAAVGLVQTTDTGQINWATATRPTVANTAAGYEIWRFNDTLQATAPIFIKLEYGTGGNASSASGSQQTGMWITVGTGSNGAGTITGITAARRMFCSSQTATACFLSAGAASTPSQSYFCHTQGFLGAVFHYGTTQTNPWGSFAVVRYCDNTGTPNGDGFVVYGCVNAGDANTLTVGWAQSVRTASPAAGALPACTVGNHALFPGAQINSLDENGNIQAFGHWAPQIKMRPLFAMCSIFAGEVAVGNTFQTALVGTTLRTFISTNHWLTGQADGFRGAMLWE